MFRRAIFLIALIAIISSATAMCRGSATYRVTFRNFLSKNRFRNLIPRAGLVYSPLAGVSHSNRQSFLTIRGFASKQVEEIAEAGNNGPFLQRAKRLQRRGEGVLSVVGADGPTLPEQKTNITLEVDCEHPFITVIGMIAPSPDWIVQINNRNVYDMEEKKFVKRMIGDLIAYDAGTDDGNEFTDPGDASLDMPSDPKLNIAPLVEDETDRFEGRVVGKFFIRKMD